MSMPQYELTKKLPSQKKQQDYYEKLREKITNFMDSKTGYANRLTPYLLFAPDLFHLLTKSMLDKRIDGKNKALIGTGILYFIAPVDFIPEGLIGPGGFIDDIIVATFVVNMLLNKFSPEVLEEHWMGDQKLLDTLKKVSDTTDGVLGKLPASSLLSRFIRAK